MTFLIYYVERYNNAVGYWERCSSLYREKIDAEKRTTELRSGSEIEVRLVVEQVR